MLHLQEFIRGPLNMLPNLVTVSRSIEKGPQDEHVKRSLKKANPLLCLLCDRRHSTLNLAMMVDNRPLIVKGRNRVWILACGQANAPSKMGFPLEGRIGLEKTPQGPRWMLHRDLRKV